MVKILFDELRDRALPVIVAVGTAVVSDEVRRRDEVALTALSSEDLVFPRCASSEDGSLCGFDMTSVAVNSRDVSVTLARAEPVIVAAVFGELS